MNAKSKAGSTPLLFAVRNAQIDTLRYLLDHGANANDIAPDGTSALNVAVVNAFYEAASVLLDYGADPNLPDARASPLHTIAWLRKPGSTGDAGVGDLPPAAPRPTGNVTSLELAKKLLAHGANPNVRVDWPEMRFDTVGGTTRNPPGSCSAGTCSRTTARRRSTSRRRKATPTHARCSRPAARTRTSRTASASRR